MKISKNIWLLKLICILSLLLFTGCSYNQKINKEIILQNTDMPTQKPDTKTEITAKDKNIDWNKIKIPVTDFFCEEWGGTLVENSSYYFYISNSNIVKLDKKTHKKTKIVKFKGRDKRIKLYLADKHLYFIDQISNNIYSVDFSGKKKKQIFSYNILKKYKGVMKNCEILGMHIYKNEIFILLSAYEVIHYNVKNRKLKNLAYGVRNGCFFNNSFYYIKRTPSPIYKTDLYINKEDEVKKSKHYQDLLVFKNEFYYVVDDKIYKYSKTKKEKLFFELSSGQEFIQFVPSKYLFAFVYWENDNLYLSWKKNISGNWITKILPEDYNEAYGIIDNAFFYEAVDLKDEDEKILPFYETLDILN